MQSALLVVGHRYVVFLWFVIFMLEFSGFFAYIRIGYYQVY